MATGETAAARVHLPLRTLSALRNPVNVRGGKNLRDWILVRNPVNHFQAPRIAALWFWSTGKIFEVQNSSKERRNELNEHHNGVNLHLPRLHETVILLSRHTHTKLPMPRPHLGTLNLKIFFSLFLLPPANRWSIETGVAGLAAPHLKCAWSSAVTFY